MTEIDRRDLKAHGYVFSSGSDSVNSDSGKSEFDDEYYASRPPAMPLQGLENRIVKIKASVSAGERNRNKIGGNKGKAPSTTTNYPIQQSNILERNISQEKKPKRRRKRAKSKKALPPVGTVSSSSGAIPKTVASTLEKPFAIQTNISQARKVLYYKSEHLGKYSLPEYGNQIQNHQQHLLNKPSLYNKEKTLNTVRGTRFSSEWLDTSNSSQKISSGNSPTVATETMQSREWNQNRPRSTPQNQSSYAYGSRTFTADNISENLTNKIALQRALQGYNFIPFVKSTNLSEFAATTNNDSSTSATEGVPSVNATHKLKSTSVMHSVNTETIRKVPVQKVPIHVLPCSTGTRSSLLPANADLKPAKYNHQTTHGSSNIETCEDLIFTISSTASSVRDKPAQAIGRNQQPSIQCCSSPIVSEPASVFPTEVPLHNDEVQLQQDTSLTSRILNALRSFFCCKVEQDYSQFSDSH